METQRSLINESNTFRTIRSITSALSLPSAASMALFKTWTWRPPSRTLFDSDVLSTRNSWQPFPVGKLWRARCAPPRPAINGTWISRMLEEDFNYPQTYRHNLRPEYSWWERCRGFHITTTETQLPSNISTISNPNWLKNVIRISDRIQFRGKKMSNLMFALCFFSLSAHPDSANVPDLEIQQHKYRFDLMHRANRPFLWHYLP